MKSALLYNIKKCIFCMEFVFFIPFERKNVPCGRFFAFTSFTPFQSDLNNDSDDVTLKKHEINVQNATSLLNVTMETKVRPK